MCNMLGGFVKCPSVPVSCLCLIPDNDVSLVHLAADPVARWPIVADHVLKDVLKKHRESETGMHFGMNGSRFEIATYHTLQLDGRILGVGGIKFRHTTSNLGGSSPNNLCVVASYSSVSKLLVCANIFGVEVLDLENEVLHHNTSD